MIRIKDIAEMAGVSTTTVSNVIHGNTKKVSPANVVRIQEILEQTDYIPSMGARLLAGKKSNIIGVIVGEYAETSRPHITDPFLSTILGAIENEIYIHNYYMFFHQANSPEDIRLLVSKWNVDGIITIGLSEEDNLEVQKHRETSMVSIDVYYGKKSITNIGLDDYGGGYQMGKYILGRGLEKILFLADNDNGVDHYRWLGVRNAMQEAGVDQIEECHIILPSQREQRFHAHKKNLQLYRQSNALFFASDFYAVEGISMLQEDGIRVPADISVAGFDDNFLAMTIRPALTTVRQDIEKKGKLAVDSLLKLLGGEQVAESDLILPIEIVVRDTVK